MKSKTTNLPPAVGGLTKQGRRLVLEYLLQYDDGPREMPDGYSTPTPEPLSPAWILRAMNSSILMAGESPPWLAKGTVVPLPLRLICLSENWWTLFKEILRSREGLENEDWDNCVRVNVILKYAESRTQPGITMRRKQLSLNGSITAYYLLSMAASICTGESMRNTQGALIGVEQQAMILGRAVAEHLMNGQGDLICKLLTEAEAIGRASLKGRSKKIGKLAVPSSEPLPQKISEKNLGVQQAIWLNFQSLVKSGHIWGGEAQNTNARAGFRELHGTTKCVIPTYQQLLNAVAESRTKVGKQAFDNALVAVGLGFLKAAKRK